MRRLIAFGLAVLIAAVSGAQLKVAKDPLEWGTLPEIPDALGYGVPMAGVHNDALIVAGQVVVSVKPTVTGNAGSLVSLPSHAAVASRTCS